MDMNIYRFRDGFWQANTLERKLAEEIGYEVYVRQYDQTRNEAVFIRKDKELYLHDLQRILEMFEDYYEDAEICQFEKGKDVIYGVRVLYKNIVKYEGEGL